MKNELRELRAEHGLSGRRSGAGETGLAYGLLLVEGAHFLALAVLNRRS